MNFPLLVLLFSFLSLTSATHFARHRDHRAIAHKSAFLYYHNQVRQAHYAADLTWSDELASMAEGWSNACNMAHTDSSLSQDLSYGELMYVQTGDPTAEDVVDAFVSDAGRFE
jgi:uncharacterized protein YkwD